MEKLLRMSQIFLLCFFLAMFKVIYFIDLFALGISLSEEFIFRESAFLTEKEEGTKIGDFPPEDCSIPPNCEKLRVGPAAKIRSSALFLHIHTNH